MEFLHAFFAFSVLSIIALMPIALMLAVALAATFPQITPSRLWRAFIFLSTASLIASGVAIWLGPSQLQMPAGLLASPFGLITALLVQLLGTVIGSFSARYLEGEAGQKRAVMALAGVLAAVHLLLLADHWLMLILAWAAVGAALQPLLCFYPDRAFALLAAHKKRIADRLADLLLIVAAGLAWHEVGSGSLSVLWEHLQREGMSTALQFSAVGLVLATILRTALFPVHGWLIQVMEAPTPVSALLHAGVVNLGGFVLIRFAPLLEQAIWARSLLVLFGLITAVLAGMVMLTRISIKVRLAWSTVAQMGFMLLECGLGLYTLATLHLVGHSLYKAHAFLAASTVVRDTRLKMMRGPASPLSVSLVSAPFLALAMIFLLQLAFGVQAWPWWWSVILGLAWAPLLWIPAENFSLRSLALAMTAGIVMVSGLSGIALLAHSLPLGINDLPHDGLGLLALFGMLALYLCLAVLHTRPSALMTWRRWSYAGFYVDEAYTRLALQLWPAGWTADAAQSAEHQSTQYPRF